MKIDSKIKDLLENNPNNLCFHIRELIPQSIEEHWQVVYCQAVYAGFIHEIDKHPQLLNYSENSSSIEQVHIKNHDLDLFVDLRKGIAYLNYLAEHNPVIIWHVFRAVKQ